ncbi:MAG: class I SAM-dependent methyltransferase [Bacteroidia bacterium]|nr:class I SAM-dependent methyltransferase [Bacteroidia bacterium]
MKIQDLFEQVVDINDKVIILKEKSDYKNQQQTNEIFKDKWKKFENKKFTDKFEEIQKKWYLELYGFKNVDELKAFLVSKKVILDAGCGLGYKAEWFASLAPESIIIGMDFSDSIYFASEKYQYLSNLFFVKGDIADTKLKPSSIDYINCDQVIHHTENPEETFRHLSNILNINGEFACYVYAKKALPRELLDEYFREFSKKCSLDDLWKMSEQLTVLGKTLSELGITIDAPDIPLLGIKGGRYDLQRFIYWNFLKCCWNEELGYDISVASNFDWYAPSNAKRYSEEEFKNLIEINLLKIIYFHKEEACYSGRFKKINK